jgi:hypothetical protein
MRPCLLPLLAFEAIHRGVRGFVAKTIAVSYWTVIRDCENMRDKLNARNSTELVRIAGMAVHEDRRAEEAAWMANFDRDFTVRHARAFDALYRQLGLDYFGIDCAELSDGRLLLFEADVAMIVHALDSDVTFPYKKFAMAKLFAAFESALRKRSGS